MKKGSYGRSKLIGHSPVQRKWIIVANPNTFTDISHLAIFYVNCDDTNIATVSTIGSPVLSLPLNELKLNNLDYYYTDITKTIQLYGSGCYFFVWINTLGEIQNNQLLVNDSGSDINEECLVYTSSLELSWMKGSIISTINSIRGAYIKNPALYIDTTFSESNILRLTYGDVNK